MFRVILLGFLIFTVSAVVVPTSIYAISLDDDEEDAEDVADLLDQAKEAAKSESFSKADALLEKAQIYGVESDEVATAKEYTQHRKKEYEHRVKVEKVAKLLKQAKKAADNESFGKADSLIKEAYGYHVSIDSVKKTRTYITQKRQERDARLERQRQTSRQNRYITSLGYDAPRYNYDKYTLWYRPYISISDGSHIWAKVTQAYRGDCYQLLVGSSDSSIYGNCSNCSNDINGYWSCHANGTGSFTVNGNPAQAANAIVQRSR